MADFTYLEIYYKNNTSGSLYQSTIYKVSDVQNFDSGTSSHMSGAIGVYRSSRLFIRQFMYVSNTQVRIPIADPINGGASSSNSVIIPCYIYGLK